MRCAVIYYCYGGGLTLHYVIVIVVIASAVIGIDNIGTIIYVIILYYDGLGTERENLYGLL